jgi:hypothetical protein
MGLRAKITLALLVTGLTSAILVGLIAHSIFLQQFNRAAYEASFQAFHADVIAYVEEHGSLEVAEQVEPFSVFVARRRQTVPASVRNVGAGGPADPARGHQADRVATATHPAIVLHRHRWAKAICASM